MDSFVAGTHVFFWNSAGAVVYATVESVTTNPDVLVLRHATHGVLTSHPSGHSGRQAQAR
ncbi:hypothetical protein K438DRAFT_1849736 [Mycena galopus ATCC 62051]|nr:hypothetical protein K438DRAFT_1854976 [Mycena galopus ATCC 62051]KAF8173949.1 hypothetical protein K438DRAFT_1849736 [Mycena galopus ATCC 62051]